MIMSSTAFCFRACTGDPRFCPADYDQMGCWFLTGNSVGPEGTWQNCESDSGDPPGVINGKTYSQVSRCTVSPLAVAHLAERPQHPRSVRSTFERLSAWP